MLGLNTVALHAYPYEVVASGTKSSNENIRTGVSTPGLKVGLDT